MRIDEIIVVRRSVARNDVREDRPQRSGHVEPPRDAPRVARVDERREDRRIGGDVFVGGGNDLVEKAGIGRVLDAELDLVAAVFDVVDVVTKACFAATLPGDERDTPVRKRVVVPKRSGTVRPELRLIDLQPFQRMRPRVHPLGFEHVVRAANARRRARLRALGNRRRRFDAGRFIDGDQPASSTVTSRRRPSTPGGAPRPGVEPAATA